MLPLLGMGLSIGSPLGMGLLIGSPLGMGLSIGSPVILPLLVRAIAETTLRASIKVRIAGASLVSITSAIKLPCPEVVFLFFATKISKIEKIETSTVNVKRTTNAM